MRVEWAVLCRHAEGRSSGFDLRGAGTNTFWIPAFPGEVSFYLVLQFAGELEEFDSDHEVEVYLTGPTTSAADLAFTLERRPQLAGNDDVEVYEIQPLAVTFEAEAEAVYALDIYLDGDRQKTVFLRVRGE